MMLRTFRPLALLLLIVMPLSALEARVLEDDICWSPDIEFPVPCHDDED